MSYFLAGDSHRCLCVDGILWSKALKQSLSSTLLVFSKLNARVF